jgi:D-serine deaminase-like pyridoxal phosphate-dependent protein
MRAASSRYRYYRQVFLGRQLPFAYVDLDLLKINMRRTIARAGNLPVRIASKSIRCVALLEKILAAHPNFRGVMCYSPLEAAALARRGFDDLLVAYPCWHADQVGAVCAEVRRGASITLMVDSIEHAARLAVIATAHGVMLPVCLDIDMSIDVPGLRFGVLRSAIRTPEEALRVLAAIERGGSLRLDGVMGYEAQIAGVGDAVAGQGAKNTIVWALKQRSLPIIAERRGAIVAALRARGAQLRFVNGGGTGSLETTARDPSVTELAAGSAFFAPALFDQYRAFSYEPAAGFAIEVVRRPAPKVYTCFAGGYVASGAAGSDKLPQPYLPEGAALTPLEAAGEVQTPISYDGPEQVSLGDPIFMRHAKAGELCERFNTLLLVAAGAITGEAPTYRGEGWSFG